MRICYRYCKLKKFPHITFLLAPRKIGFWFSVKLFITRCYIFSLSIKRSFCSLLNATGVKSSTLILLLSRIYLCCFFLSNLCITAKQLVVNNLSNWRQSKALPKTWFWNMGVIFPTNYEWSLGTILSYTDFNISILMLKSGVSIASAKPNYKNPFFGFHKYQ